MNLNIINNQSQTLQFIVSDILIYSTKIHRAKQIAINILDKGWLFKYFEC